MNKPTVTPAVVSQTASAAPPRQYRGQVVYLFAFDVAHDTNRQPVGTLLGHEATPFVVDVDKRAPRELFFYQPQMVRLPAQTWDSPTGPVQVQRMIKLFPVGALSIAFCVPFEVDQLEQLVAYHDHPTAHHEAGKLAQQAVADLGDWLIRPAGSLRDEEAYIVFCVDSSVPGAFDGAASVEDWLKDNRRRVTGLLTQESQPQTLSEQETHETAGKSLSYYGHDLVVVDWDAALLVDHPSQFESTLHIMELANVQLAELEAYDRLLDDALKQAYRDLRHTNGFGSRSAVLRNLREFRLDMARLSDELSNTTKFFGEWHLARVYQNLYDRFHLRDWHQTIESKLRTLDDLYRIHKQDQVNIWMMILEATIVLLFIIDLIALVMMSHSSG